MPFYNPFYNFGPEFWLYLLAFVIVMIAQAQVSGAYAKYRRVSTRRGYTGAQVARQILDANGLTNVPVEMSRGGQLSDHYDPSRRVVRLSPSVYQDSSIASVAVAAHEVGHAIQHKVHYPALAIRNRMLPAVNIASQLGWVALFIGLFFGYSEIVYIGLIGLIAMAVFQLVTLPIELNASNRAMKIITAQGFLFEDEIPMARKMLNAAAFTYIAALLSTLLNILRIFLIARRNDN
ncbi:MAG: zinc metallopeptidase [Erysipelotrichaceae bacterium]